MKQFQLTNETMQVLKNFTQINPSFLIKSTEAIVRNQAKNCVAIYRFPEPLEMDVEAFGLYEFNDFISIISAFKNPTLSVNDSYILITEAKSKMKYFTTPLDMIPCNQKPILKYVEGTKVYTTEQKFSNVSIELDFVIPQEKLNILLKMVSLMKTESVFFESVEDAVRITVGNELESSHNTWEMTIDTDIKINNLDGKALKIGVSELKLLPADYNVKMSTMGVSCWTSNIGVVYYVGLDVV